MKYEKIRSSVTINKGDVVWVPYRKDPNWPALVQNVYPNKLTYVFFPLPHGSLKAATFRCHPKNVCVLSVCDQLPDDATNELKHAFREACNYLKENGISDLSTTSAFFDNPQKSSGENENEQTNVSDKSEEPESSVSLGEGVHNEKKGSTGKGLRKREERMKYSKKRRRTESEVSSQSINVKYKEKKSKLSMSKKVSRKLTNDGMKQDAYLSHFINQIIYPTNDCVFLNGNEKTEVQSREDAVEVALREAAEVSSRLMTCPNRRMSFYSPPPRNEMNIQINTAKLLTDPETDCLVERCLAEVRKHQPEFSLLVSLHFTAQFVIPAVMQHALMKSRNISYEEAESILNGTQSEKKVTSEPVVNGRAFEELVRIACREKEKLEAS